MMQDPWFLIGALVLTVAICIAIVRSPRIARTLSRMVGQPPTPYQRPLIDLQTDSDARTVDRSADRELQQLAALRDKGQISEETFLARQAILARRKGDK
jgi:hypothetical protein